MCMCMCVYSVCVYVCVCVYAQSDRCCNAIVMHFNAYWAALPAGEWHTLLIYMTKS